MAKKFKVSDADAKQAHKVFLEAVGPTFNAMGHDKLFGRFKGQGLIARFVSKRQYEKFLESGGKAGDWASFLEWLKANLPQIIAIILSLF